MTTALRIVPASNAAAERALLERALDGRYRLGERVGVGGMGAVYQAWEPVLERRIAVKVLSPEHCADAESRGRFRREARVTAQLAHPGIVPVLAWGETDRLLWYAMPWLEGGTLALRLAGGRLGVEEARALLLELTEAIGHAHAHHVIHRDLKAENVMFDETGRARLTDFGVATVQTSEHSRSEAAKGMGTPHYMAPEQLLGRADADHRADLYALGVLGFRMLTGRFPFEGEAAAVAAQHVANEAPPVSGYRSDIPAPLADAIDRCLAKKPQDRWPDAASFALALRAPAPARRFRVGRLRLLLL